LVADGLLGGELEVDIEGSGEVFALSGEAGLDGLGVTDAVAEGIDAEDGAAGFTLKQRVEFVL